MSYSQYIGLEFADKGRGPAFDCWGLVLHLLEQEQGITGLPDFRSDYAHTKDKASIPGLVDRESRNWQKVDDPQEGDVAVFRIAGKPMHVGYLVDSKRFLHVHRNINTCMESLDSLIWKNRIEGVYRYGKN